MLTSIVDWKKFQAWKFISFSIQSIFCAAPWVSFPWIKFDLTWHLYGGVVRFFQSIAVCWFCPEVCLETGALGKGSKKLPLLSLPNQADKNNSWMMTVVKMFRAAKVAVLVAVFFFCLVLFERNQKCTDHNLPGNGSQGWTHSLWWNILVLIGWSGGLIFPSKLLLRL